MVVISKIYPPKKTGTFLAYQQHISDTESFVSALGVYKVPSLLIASGFAHVVSFPSPAIMSERTHSSRPCMAAFIRAVKPWQFLLSMSSPE